MTDQSAASGAPAREESTFDAFGQPLERKRPIEETPAIVAEGLCIAFRPFMEKRRSIRRHGLRVLKRESEPVVALDDVSLTVRRGEALGIIGSNGAGKSTLLRVLCGALSPDSGTVTVYANSPPTLLALGLGFNRSLSGRRNIYLGGLASGLRKARIDEIFDDIVAYSELGTAIERPVDTYSSGMFARLAFSVAIQSRPEILLLDEAMTVGDEAFRKKSGDSMRGLLEEAGTIVMVSHGLGRLKAFCDRIAWLDKGRFMDVGNPEEITDRYRAHIGVAKPEVEDED